jgi:two-component system sensor histidine kinase UhpB
VRRRTLFTQVLILNASLVCLAALLAATLAGLELEETARVVTVILSAAALSLVVNLAVLRRRFTPLENLIEDMEKVDLARPGANLPPSIDGKAETEEVERIELAFLRMMRRLEAERRRAGSAALRAQEEERARVARDLHDEVNQSLTGVLLHLEAARAAAPPELKAELDQTKKAANQAMSELLTLARQLRPTALDDLGLRAAVEGLTESFDAGDIAISFSAEGEFTTLPEDVQLVVYRVAQEALSNAARHSAASNIDVSLARRHGDVTLEVRDDGSGFAFAESETGLGLAGMRERSLLVDGHLNIESRPGNGTTVRLRVDPGAGLPDTSDATH